jgi:hypothetical protein
MHHNIATTCILRKVKVGDISYDGALDSLRYGASTDRKVVNNEFKKMCENSDMTLLNAMHRNFPGGSKGNHLVSWFRFEIMTCRTNIGRDGSES